ncbi:MAG: hypothetical protein EOO68_40685 [Moraxellaceae bacterium]|nr:MAG: hypothetical protein EOO68_40685 [Moraxellaceae bacterium]
MAAISKIKTVNIVALLCNQIKAGSFIFGTVLFFCASTCQADKSIFCGAADQLKKIQFIPIRQMDNEMLLESVANTLDKSMSSEARLLNNYWLHNSDENSRVNKAAINRVIAITLTTYYDLAVQSLIPGEPDKHAVEHTALVGLLGNYSVRVSRHSAQIGWNLQF